MSTSLPRNFTQTLRVRYGECDPQGVVFNGNYLLYLDVAMTEFWREHLGGYAAMVDGGVDFMLVHSDLTFRAPARADELIDIYVEVASLGTTSFGMRGLVRRGDDLLLEAELHYVFVSVEHMTKVEMPADVRRRLSG